MFRGLGGEVCVDVGCLEPTREHTNHDIFWKIVSNPIENSPKRPQGALGALWSLVGAEDAVQRVRTPCGINVGNRRVFRGLVGEVCVVVGCLEPASEHANHDIFWKITSTEC